MLRAATLITEDRTLSRVLAGLLLFFAALLALIYAYRGSTYVLVAFAGLLFFAWASWRAWTFPVLTLLYIIVISRNVGELNLPFYFHPLSLIPLLTLSTLLFQANRILDPGKRLQTFAKPDSLGVFVGLLTSWIIFIFLYGMAVGNPPLYMHHEMSYLSMYLFYFFWRGFFRYHNHIIQWNWFLLGAGIIAGIELLLYIAINFSDVLHFIMYRMLNRQSMITLLTVPLAMTFFIINKKLLMKLFGIGLISMSYLHVFLTQQRSIWLGVAVVSFVYFTLFFFRNGMNTRKFLLWLLVLLLIATFMFSILFIAAHIMQSDIDTLLTRWEDVQNLKDSSFQIRVHDNQDAIRQVGDKWYVGMGVGELNNWLHTGWNFYYYDISYGMAYYKGGLPMLLLILIVYITITIRTFTLYLTAKDEFTRLLGITYTSTMFGLFFVSFFNTGLLYYRYVVIWMMIGAMTTVMLEQSRQPTAIESES